MVQIFFYISVNFLIRFSGNEFSQDCCGHHSAKCHVWEKVYLLSSRSQSYSPIRPHDFSECSISLTTWLWNDFLFDGVRESGEYTDPVTFSVSMPKLA